MDMQDNLHVRFSRIHFQAQPLAGVMITVHITFRSTPDEELEMK